MSSHHTTQGDGFGDLVMNVQINPRQKNKSLCKDASSQKAPVPPRTERLLQEESGSFLQIAQGPVLLIGIGQNFCKQF